MKPQRLLLGILLSTSFLGSVYAQTSHPAPAAILFSAQGVHSKGLGPWTFEMPEAKLQNNVACTKLSGIYEPQSSQSIWSCEAKVQVGTAYLPTAFFLEFKKESLQEVWFFLKGNPPASEKEWIQKARPAFAFLQATCPGKLLQAEVSEELEFSGISQRVTVENVAHLLVGSQKKTGAHIEVSCPASESKTYLDLEASGARFRHTGKDPPVAEEASATFAESVIAEVTADVSRFVDVLAVLLVASPIEMEEVLRALPVEDSVPFRLSAFAGFEKFELGMTHAALAHQLKMLPLDAKCRENSEKRTVFCDAFPVMNGRLPVGFVFDNDAQQTVKKAFVMGAPLSKHGHSAAKAKQAITRLLAYLQKQAGPMVILNPRITKAKDRPPATVKQIFNILQENHSNQPVFVVPQIYVRQERSLHVVGGVMRTVLHPGKPPSYHVMVGFQ